MYFDTLKPINLTICPNCNSSGYKKWRSCPTCHGFGAGYLARGRWHYWKNIGLLGDPVVGWISRWGTRAYNLFILVVSLIFAGLLAVDLYQYQLYLGAKENPSLWWGSFPIEDKTWLILSLGLVVYFAWRIWRTRVTPLTKENFYYKSNDAVSGGTYTWEDVRKLKRKNHIDLKRSSTNETVDALALAFNQARRNKLATVPVEYLIYFCLSFNRIGRIFTRLGSPSSTAQKELGKILPRLSAGPKDHVRLVASDELLQTIHGAYELAFQNHRDNISIIDLFASAVSASVNFQTILQNQKIDLSKLSATAEWERLSEEVSHAHTGSQARACNVFRPLRGKFIDKYLNNLMSKLCAGNILPAVGREKETDEILHAIESGHDNLLIVGPRGAGKMAIVEQVVWRVSWGDVPPQFDNRQIMILDDRALFYDAEFEQLMKRWENTLKDCVRSNAVIFIHDLQNLLEIINSGSGPQSVLAFCDLLARYITDKKAKIIVSIDLEFMTKYIASTPLSNLFQIINIEPMTATQTLRVLEVRAGNIEIENDVYLSYEALEKIVEISALDANVKFPSSALEALKSVAKFVRAHHGSGTYITANLAQAAMKSIL